MSPRVRVRRVTSARAAGDGTYRSCLMACSTRARVAGRTFGRSLSTRDTVWCDTPASRATSKIVAARVDSRAVIRWLELSGRHLILRPNRIGPGSPIVALEPSAIGAEAAAGPILGKVVWSWSRFT